MLIRQKRRHRHTPLCTSVALMSRWRILGSWELIWHTSTLIKGTDTAVLLKAKFPFLLQSNSRNQPEWKHHKLVWFVHARLSSSWLKLPRTLLVNIYRAQEEHEMWDVWAEPKGYKKRSLTPTVCSACSRRAKHTKISAAVPPQYGAVFSSDWDFSIHLYLLFLSCYYLFISFLCLCSLGNYNL